MKIIKTLSLAILISSIYSTVTFADLLSDVKAKGILTVGTEMQYAPFDFLKNNKQVGFNPDIFKEIGKELGVSVKFSDLPWPSVLPGLTASKFDMVAGPLTINAERAKKYRFTSPIDKSSFSLIQRTSDDSFKDHTDIKGKVVGGLRGDVSLIALKKIAKENGAKEVREYGNSGQAYADLATGRIVAVSNQTANNGYTAAQRPEVFKLVPGTFGEIKFVAFAGRNDENSESLINAVNAAIKVIQDDGRLAEIQTKWLGQPVSLPEHIDATKY